MRVPFIAYAEDCRVSGEIEVDDADRLTDVLNERDEVTIFDATLVAHADGHVVTMDQLDLARDDVLAVEAAGTRGPEERRIHTVRHRMELHLGGYAVLGQMHTMPGGQPLVAIGRRLPMIPLTNATLAYNDAEGLEVRDVGTLIVNRGLIDWIRAAEGEDLSAFPDIRVASPAF